MAELKDLAELKDIKAEAATGEKASSNEVEKVEERKPVVDKLGRAYGTGRRKDASARVWIKKGTGKVVVNKKDITEYFKRPVLRMVLNQPFVAVDSKDGFDVFATVIGGGLSGQAGAIRHGISRALDNFDPTSNHKILRQGGFLTRDSRVVERKKPGQPKARKKFQFSKR